MEGKTLRPFIWNFVNTPGHYKPLIAGTAQERLAGGAEIFSENPKEISDVRRMNVSKASASQYRTIVAVIIFSCLVVLALHRWDRLLIVKPKPVRLDTGRNHIPIQIYLKIAWRRQFSIQPDEVNIPYDFDTFICVLAGSKLFENFTWRRSLVIFINRKQKHSNPQE